MICKGNVGTGVVIARRPDGKGWSGPASVGAAGVSVGFLAGASKIDYVMILPNEMAVRQFTGKGQLRLGGEIQVAAEGAKKKKIGPIGREASGSVGAGDKGVSVVFSYSHAQGLYGGLALDGVLPLLKKNKTKGTQQQQKICLKAGGRDNNTHRFGVSVRPDCNAAFYKKTVTCEEILSGAAEPPPNEEYETIVHLLESYCKSETSQNDAQAIKNHRYLNDLSLEDGDVQEKEGVLDSQYSQPGRRQKKRKQAFLRKFRFGTFFVEKNFFMNGCDKNCFF
ncbi:hypothetical protein RFI_05437 [Reticulomyxa filosa]|uniref:Ysc84 actin-binding domain-containing protein n=1 Tax=Reticulomyxa filosa TaxID=46433 RepID=X6P0C2_RETFI|nr:hypothetical protein RFI_05437 [Reticulomyxa filosa]|eukprot:ETO31686.1 hypothetical protein RFI_05437 [Reticulomyxa filosa]